MLVVGTDSHTTTYGALGRRGHRDWHLGDGLRPGHRAAVVPGARDDPATSSPGDLQPAVSWKDVILHLAGRFGSDGAQYRSMEFGGPGAARTDMSSRLTVANMALEMGPSSGCSLRMRSPRRI